MREPNLEVFHQDENKQQRVYRFENGYGASVVTGPKTYGGVEGLWELAVIRYTGSSPVDFDIDKTTSAGDTVHGNLTDQDVETLLSIIERLDAHGHNLSS